jgi:prepilin peptidase CpaA
LSSFRPKEFVVETLPVPVIVVLVAVLIAAVTDLRAFKIHNVLTLPLLLSGLVYHGVTNGAEGFVESLLGALFGFGILLLLYLTGGMGGGDVKLMAGIGAWLGVPTTLVIILAACIAAGVYALVIVVASGRIRETLVRFQIMWYRVTAVGRNLAAEDRVEETVQKNDRRGRVVPFGTMTGVGLVALIAIARLRLPH